MNKKLLIILLIVPVIFLFVACSQQPSVLYTLNVQIEGEGAVYPSSGSFTSGHLITFTFAPKAGYSFSHWSGRDSQQVVNSNGRYEVLMDRNMFLTAVFTGSSDTEYDLTVRIEGKGNVYPNSGRQKKGSIVTFDIQPETGWFFSRWEGDNCWDVIREGNKWTLKMDGNKNITALFERTQGGQNNLDIIIEGRGRVEEKFISEVDAKGNYPTDSVIILTAHPETGWVFKEWLGDLSGKIPVSQIVMDSNKRVIAVFTQGETNLTVNIVGRGIVEQRLISDFDVTEKYPEYSEVRLFARPDNGWAFKEWQGDVRGYEPLVKVLMDKDKTVIAVFEELKVNLNITIRGKGTVEKRLITDSEEYPVDSVVRLWAKPANGWSFDCWSGDAQGKDIITYVEMDQDRNIIATFEQAAYSLEIDVIGQGKVTQKLIGESYDEGDTVRLTAVPNSGWAFKSWAGDAKGTRETIDILMDSNKLIVAEFEIQQGYKLYVDITGNGRVSISPDKSYYTEGEKVTLSATAETGWYFNGWRGDASGTNSQIQITMNRNMNIEALFEKGSQSGNGEVAGTVKITHTWPHPYTGSNSAVKSENVGKIPVLHNLGGQPIVRQEYVPGELIVGFRDGNDRIRLMGEVNQIGILERAGVQVLRSIPELDAHIVAAPMDETSFKAELNRLKALNEVMYVEPNYIAYALNLSSLNTKVPNDPMYNRQWHYKQIRLPHAWAVTTGSSSVRVAVLDTGVNSSHPDLKGRVDTASGWNFVSNNSSTNDVQGHGTHCAGTIGAATNNGVGVAGVMWQGQIIPVKVLGDNGSGTFEGIAKGVLYASGLLSERPISQRAHILSMSLGGSSGSTILQNACKQAVNAGVLVVVAAGNDNGPIGYPGRYPECITIGATDYNYPNRPKRAPYSSYGAELDIMAPGGSTAIDTDKDGYKDGVLSTTGSSYQFFQGTSMATPHVAGICGLMLSNGVPASEVRAVLRRTAMDLGGGDFSNQFGYGLVNVYWAVCNVKEIKILIGTKNGNRINAVAEGQIDLRAKSYTLSKIPAGEYQVFGWIDVQKTGTIDSGDYLFESNKMTFKDGQKLTANIELKEVK